MNSKIETLENSTVKLTLVIAPEKFEEGLKHAYNKNKSKVNMPGFRKGKVPRMMIEKTYGREFFYDDAIDFVFPDAYTQAVETHKLDVVARPEIDSVDYDESEGLSLGVTVTVKPSVTLGEYKGLSYEDSEVSVTNEDIDAEIDRAREKNARIESVTGSPVALGDTAVIDFEGFVDGVPFDGGKAENHKLEIGSHSFIDTFEEQLVGKNIGDSLDVSVTFPEEYHSEELAGKPAVFKVKINEISRKELPALDDDFAQDVSEFDTFAEYKSDVKDKLYKQKEQEKQSKIEAELIEKACANASVDVPEVMVENQVRQMVGEFESRLRMQGMDLEMFFKFSGQDYDAFAAGYKESAEKNVLARLVLEEIAKAEGIEPSEDDVNEEIVRIAGVYGIEEEKMREIIHARDLDGLKTDLKTQKALKIITESAVKA